MGNEVAQIPLRELLGDPVFRSWFVRRPQDVDLKTKRAMTSWRLMVQRRPGGRWAKADVEDYETGFAWIKANLKEVHDCALVALAREYAPPRDLVIPADHHWCGYCRRPTRFWYFRQHHTFQNHPGLCSPFERRCTICGIRLVALKKFVVRHADLAAW